MARLRKGLLVIGLVLAVGVWNWGCGEEPAEPRTQKQKTEPERTTGRGSTAETQQSKAPIEPTGTPVTTDTSLTAGDAVEVKWGNQWWNGEVLKVRDDGKVKIHYVGWDKRWDEVVPRKRLRK